MADADSCSDSGFVHLSEEDGCSVGSDSDGFVIVGEDFDSSDDLFGGSENDLEKVVEDIESCDSEDDSQKQLENRGDDTSSVNADFDEFPEPWLVDYSDSEPDEVLLDFSGSQRNGRYVATSEFHRYPCRRIGHVCGDDCYEVSGEKKASENIVINDAAMEYVLPFLPAKTLCRFRSVGKKWDEWISNPFFSHKQTCFFRDISGFFCQLPGEKPSFVSLNRDAYGVPSPSLDFLPESVTVRTACNGLLCCESLDGENTYYICNPVNKQWKVLPKIYDDPKSGMVFWETLAGAVLAFNLELEQYDIMLLPQCSGPQGVMTEMYGELCYLMPVLEGSGYNLEIYGDMDMKRKHIIPLVGEIFTSAYEELRVLACVNDDVVIMLLGVKLIAYHVKTKKADIIHSDTGTRDGYASYIPYVNSLVNLHHP